MHQYRARLFNDLGLYLAITTLQSRPGSTNPDMAPNTLAFCCASRRAASILLHDSLGLHHFRCADIEAHREQDQRWWSENSMYDHNLLKTQNMSLGDE
jgi:hypothetical protein